MADKKSSGLNNNENKVHSRTIDSDVEVDVSQALKGLKGLRREAKKATQAINEQVINYNPSKISVSVNGVDIKPFFCDESESRHIPNGQLITEIDLPKLIGVSIKKNNKVASILLKEFSNDDLINALKERGIEVVK